MAYSEEFRHKQLMSSLDRQNKTLEKVNTSIINLTNTFNVLSRLKNIEELQSNKAERYKQLILNMIDYIAKDEFGEFFDISDTINQLFVMGFTEEEMLELGICTEEDIDKANEDNTSNDI